MVFFSAVKRGLNLNERGRERERERERERKTERKTERRREHLGFSSRVLN